MGLTFKREPKIVGLVAAAYRKDKRPCFVREDCISVAVMQNAFYKKVFEGEDVWRITVFATVDGKAKNVLLKARFAKLEEAQTFIRRHWEGIKLRWDMRRLETATFEDEDE